MIDYVSLHNHTSISLMNSLLTPKALFERAGEFGQKAVAVTDHGSMAAVWDCLKLQRSTGIKFIAGCELYFVDDVADPNGILRHIIVLAKNQVGYRNLLLLHAEGYDNYIVAFKRSIPRIDWKMLEKYREGLIVTTACGNGILGQSIMQNKFDQAVEQAKRLKNIFGDDLAIELQPHNLQRKQTAYSGPINQQKINLALKKIAEQLNIRPIVATDAHYLNKEDHFAHDVQVADGCGQPIKSGNRLRYDKPDFHYKCSLEIAQYFLRHKKVWGEQFIKSLFENTMFFADQCEMSEWIDPKFSNPSGKELPEFPVKDEADYPEFLKWKETYPEKDLDEDVLFYRYRIEQAEKTGRGGTITDAQREGIKGELEVLEYHGFSSYMLIVADYINEAKRRGIPVGPGRGSVGGSHTAYLTDIHEAHPEKHHLIFSRFHNKKKTSFPDIDTDFAPSGRNEIQDYIRQKYGEDHVAHVSNINTITPKVYARDIARTFEFGGDRSKAAEIGNEIADSIPAEMKSVTQALEHAPLFAEWAKLHPELAEFAPHLNGVPRAWSTHAGGLVIGRRPLRGLVPLRRDANGAVVLEFDKDRAEEVGLVKMDTLGLETLDINKECRRLIEEQGKTPPPLPFDYHMEDDKTYNLLAEGNTFCVFQMAGVATPVCKMLKPRSVDDIALVTALIRPAAKAIINDFLKVRNGDKPLELIHPTLDRALRPTYGFGLYEECLMWIAADVAGWDLHKADALRKMTKAKGKYPEKVKQLREEFIEDAQKNKNVDEESATRIWDEIISDFGGYGFNRSVTSATLVDIFTNDGQFIISKPIQDVESGEFVRSRDEQTGDDIFIEVIDRHDHGELDVVEVELTTGERVRCTMNHKFRTVETGEMLPLRQIISEGLSIVVNDAKRISGS